MLILITVPKYSIFAHTNLLRKFKQEHLEFCTIILIAVTKLFMINASAQWK